MHFIDEAKIFIKSGTGGAGCTSFRREAHTPKGGPDGGNGGRGGHIIAECVEGKNTLIDYRFQQHFRARIGQHGMGKNRSGFNADDILIHVPKGTEILAEDKKTVIVDFTEIGQKVILAKGGDGGFGNAHYKSSTNQAPRKSTKGWDGEEKWIWLHLKLMADVGLVGLPNAGKSTFLAAVSRARPKIADYPFTTLIPNLGVVYVDEKEFVMADIPGLIAGASQGIGLGHRFLAHVERCQSLLHLVDGTEDDIIASYKTIRQELADYGHGLTDKKEVIALNKCDALVDEMTEERIQELEKFTGQKVYAISGATKKGIEQVLRIL